MAVSPVAKLERLLTAAWSIRLLVMLGEIYRAFATKKIRGWGPDVCGLRSQLPGLTCPSSQYSSHTWRSCETEAMDCQTTLLAQLDKPDDVASQSNDMTPRPLSPRHGTRGSRSPVPIRKTMSPLELSSPVIRI